MFWPPLSLVFSDWRRFADRGSVDPASQRGGVASFNYPDIHAHDVGTILDREGVAVRTGHHCAQPVMERYGLAATVRASLALYNTREDVDRLVAAVEKVRKVFR